LTKPCAYEVGETSLIVEEDPIECWWWHRMPWAGKDSSHAGAVGF